MTRIVGLASAAAMALGIVVAQGSGAAQAAPPGLAGGLQAAADGISLAEPAQFIFGGRNYCFYLDGWHGPGWYWCGYAHRRGVGWGGPRGWHGWHHDGRPSRGPHGRPSHGGGPHGGPHHHH